MSLLNHQILSRQAKQWVIAFHGYGQQASVFEPLAKMIDTKYNFMVIELPIESYAKAIQKMDFRNYIETLLKEYNIEKMTAISYSMGSRFNLCIAELLPQRLQKIITVAPDGVRMRIWNRFSTNTGLGRLLFRYFVRNKNAYQNLLSILYKIKFMPSSLYAFSKWHMRDTHTRTKVYNAWMNMKNLIPNLKVVEQNIRQYQIPIMAYFGKDDQVIDRACMKKMKKYIPSATIIEMDKGHNLLDKDLFKNIAAQL